MPPYSVPMLLLALSLLAVDTTRAISIRVAEAESLEVTIAGEGEAVVLIPGLFGSAYSYRRVLSLLDEAGFQAMVIEPLGLGLSSRPADADYSLAAQADRVVEAMDSLGVESAVLVGHSVGASIALRIGYRHPERVRAIVSLEGGPGETAATPGFKRWVRFAPLIRLLNGRRLALGMVTRGMKAASADGSWVDPTAVLGYAGRLATEFGSTLSAYQAMARAEEPELLHPRLGDILCPVVLLVGGHKHTAGPPEAEVMAFQRGLPTFSVDTVPGSGFFVQEEQPAAVANAVQRLLAPASVNLSR